MRHTIAQRIRKCLPAAVFLLLALWLMAPALRQLRSTVPTGDTRVATVPLFNAWTIWWNADRVSHGLNGYWDAPIFHPTSGTFAFSEPQPATLLVAPVYWISGSPVVAYKAWLVLGLALNGLFAFRLLRRTGTGRLVASVGGVMLLTLPIVHQQLEVLQMIPLWGIVWTWDAAWRLSRNPSAKRGLEVGVACGVTFMISVHHGLFMVLLLPAAAVLWRFRWEDPALWKAVAVAAVAAGMLVGSLVVPLHRIAARHEFERSSDAVSGLSLHAADYAAVAPHALLNPHLADGRRGWEFSPGWIKLLLATIGIGMTLYRRRYRDWRLFLTATLLLAGLLSLGPNLQIGTWKPWLMLAWWIPGISQVRNVFRFAYFVQIAVALLAAAGLQDLMLGVSAGAGRRPKSLNRPASHGAPAPAETTRSRSRLPGGLRIVSRLRFVLGHPGRVLATATVFMMGGMAVIEIPPAPFLLAGVPNLDAHHGWTTYVRENTPADRGIACIPFSGGASVRDYDISTRWMYYATLHKVPIANGYSGFFPQRYFAIREAVNREFPGTRAFTELASANVEFIVVYRSRHPVQELRSVDTPGFRLEHVFNDPVGIDVYRLTRTDVRVAN